MNGESFDSWAAGGYRGREVSPGTARADALRSTFKPLCEIGAVLSSRYLIKGWLDRGALSVVYGESNVGKTFLALDLALHVAAGWDWHGNRVPRDTTWCGPVVYVAGEGGLGINNRIAAIRRNRPELVRDSEEKSGFVLLPTALDLCTSADGHHLATAIGSWVSQRPIALIVVDTLARSMGAGDENTAKDMGAFVRSVDLLRARTGAHVMVIHHSGKDTTRGARGSGSLRAAADTEIELTNNGIVVVAETKKQRDMPRGSVFAYTLQDIVLGNDEDGAEVKSAIVCPAEPPTKRKPLLKGQALIAMQAFGDALAEHGATRPGEDFPKNRQCVSLSHWRHHCDRHSLSSGEGESSKRSAFHKAWKGLQEKGHIRVIDGFAWRCDE